MPTVWIDADAAPGACKEVAFRAADRRKVMVVLVANRAQRIPRSAFLRFVQVSAGADVADDHIAASCEAGDLVVTADIPLAARAVERGAIVVTPTGEELTADNVRQRLSVRDFLDDLRGGGVMTGGPPPYGDKDKQRFANALDRWLTKALRTPG
jgi:uncharacterized protein YaiI (UPF0178 family)